MHESLRMSEYFERIDKEIASTYSEAQKARKNRFDPEDFVDIPIARNMAERVEGLISAVAPQLKGTGMIQRIEELEEKYGKAAWQIALIIALEVAQEKFCKFKDRKESMEVGIRVGFAYHTNGIVAAPLEGFVGLEIKKTRDGKEYFCMNFSGPIRGAGGTAASVSVIIGDYVRTHMGYAPYDPDENEVKRFATEIRDYHERVTNLQYYPSEEEVLFMMARVPVEVSGDPSEKIEVSNYKDQKRIPTNKIRGGMCLVVAEGLCQKTAKINKRLSAWGKDFGIGHWAFLDEFLKLKKSIQSNKKVEEKKTKEKISPNYTFIQDLVAGRPILTYPLRPGGFRLRYGRSRTSGYSSAAIHPATMSILNHYIAIGTQLKVERPGKAASMTVNDSITGPYVRLNNGDFMQIEKLLDYSLELKDLQRIVYLGDYLVNYGDFAENNHSLVPAGYVSEWWVLELEKAMVSLFGTIDAEKLSDLTGIPSEELAEILRNKTQNKIGFTTAYTLSQKTGVPLHPYYTLFWKLITKDEVIELCRALFETVTEGTFPNYSTGILKYDQKLKIVLETLGATHKVAGKEKIILDSRSAPSLFLVLNLISREKVEEAIKIFRESESTDVLEIINTFSPVKVRDLAGTFIGARMGRPEKAKMRKLTGSPHILFPVGSQGGRLRCFQSAMDANKIVGDFSLFFCDKCNKEKIYRVCEDCGTNTRPAYFCKQCQQISFEECKKHGTSQQYKNITLDINHFFSSALHKLDLKNFPDLIKGVKGTSNKTHIPENLAKGILRAKHNIFVNKDGTTRYDMTELPITHFYPREIGVSVEKLRSIGYTQDYKGRPLEDENQLCEMYPQDVILPGGICGADEPASEVLFRVSKFIDELLVRFYNQEPYYNLKTKEDLVGHLVIGLAPHISAGIVGRIIGFSNTAGMYAHPLMHAAMRRDCDGDEACAILLMDALLNFSRQFLPDKIGGRTMDSPLVLTSKLIPSEVDDMVHGLDVSYNYPLGFYEAALQYKMPVEYPIEQLKSRIGTERQYEDFGFTHGNSDINKGVLCSAYKTLPSMEDKLRGQMELAEKIAAVDEHDVARLVIEKHLIKDTRGNLRKFSTQQFRCVKCNAKFRRPPLIGKCTKCAGKIIFTISEGSVTKYLGPSLSLATKYNVPAYLRQSLEITERRIIGVFGKDKEKQSGLGAWFG